MKEIEKRVFGIAIPLAFCLIASTSSIMSQAKPVSFAELLAWIHSDETKTDIKNWITQRKLDFEVTNDRLNEIKAEWRKIKLGNMPADLEQCINNNAALPTPPQPPPPPPTATLIVDCVNVPCDLFLNGQPFGTASPGQSYTKAGLQPDMVTVLATAKGYKDYKSTISLIPGDRPNRLSFEMEKAVGSIKVTCEPVDCEIYFDGIRLGSTNQKQSWFSDLSVGDHSIEARAQGFDSVTSKISVIADTVQTVPLTMKRAFPKGIIPDRVVQDMLAYFSLAQGANAHASYVATWEVTPPYSRKPTRITETVRGPVVEWSASEYTATLMQHAAAFNIYDTLARIQSPQQNHLTLKLEPVDETDGMAIARIAESGAAHPEYLKLKAENDSDLYELTLERFYPNWIPVIIRHQKKDGNRSTTVAACPIRKYGTHMDYILPELIKILNQKSLEPELQVSLEKAVKK
jgi:hypothetical protein